MSTDDDKNEHAVALALLGASKGGHARAAKMTREQRREAARHAVKARWALWARAREAAGLPPARQRKKKRVPKTAG